MDNWFCSRKSFGTDIHTSGISELYSDLVGLSESSLTQDWRNRLKVLIERIGFDIYLVSAGVSDLSCDPLKNIITTFPSDWVDYYKCNDLIKSDPIRKHCHNKSTPLLWRREGERANGVNKQFWCERENYGLRCGISMPLRYKGLVGSISIAYPSLGQDEIDMGWDSSLGMFFFLIPFAQQGLISISRSSNSRGCVKTWLPLYSTRDSSRRCR